MKFLSLSLIILLSVTSCNTTNKATEATNNTEQQMDSKKMIADGYLAGQISISTEEGDCPVTIKVEGENGAYYLDPIDLKGDFQIEGEQVWFKYGPLRRMNRCIKANPISIIEIVKSN
jgi:hypothetical protein